MALYTASQAGNVNDSATWGGAGTPGSGDTAQSSGYNLTATADWTVGDAPATPATVLSLTNCYLAINSGINVDIRGNLQLATGASVRYLSGGAGGRLRLKDVPDGQAYAFKVSAAHNDTSYIEILGNAGTPFTLDGQPASSTGVGYVEDGSYIGGGQMRVQYANVTLGNGTYNIELWGRDNTAWDYYWKNCTFTACGQMKTTVAIAANSKFNVLDNYWTGSLGTYPLYISFSTSFSGGQRNILRNDLDNTFAFITPYQVTLEYNTFRNANTNPTLTYGTGPWASFYRNVYVHPRTSSVSMSGGSWSECYLVGTSTGTNIHCMSPVTVPTIHIDDCVWDFSAGDVTGDLVLIETTGTTTRYRRAKGNLVLPARSGAAAGQPVGIFVSGAAPPSGLTFDVLHNTVPTMGTNFDTGAPLRLNETSSAYAGMVPKCDSNISYGVAAAEGYVIKWDTSGSSADGCISEADYNCGWSIFSGAAFTGNYQPPAGKIAGTPGASDVNVNPQFVDTPGTRHIVWWDTNYGSGTGTVAAALDYIRGDPTNRILDLWTKVRAGYEVQNASLSGAGHDAVTIGACAYTAGASAQTLNGSPAQDLWAATLGTVTAGGAPTPPPSSGAAGISLDGTDLGDFYCSVTDLQGFGFAPGDITRTKNADRPGSELVRRDVLERSCSVTLLIVGTDLADLEANQEALGRFLNSAPKPMELALDARPNWLLDVEVVGLEEVRIQPVLAQASRYVRLELLALDPLWRYDSESSQGGITTTAVQLAQGTGQSYPRLKIPGPSTGCTVYFEDYLGNVVRTLQLVGTLSASQFWMVDCESRTVYKNTSGTFGTGTAVLNELQPPVFHVIEPEHSAQDGSAFTRVRQTGAGAAMTAYWTKRWR